MLGIDEEVAGKIGSDKIDNIRAANVDGIITACGFCDIQLTQVQFGDEAEGKNRIPVLQLTQYLGAALGIALGVSLNKISPEHILASQ